MNFARLKSLRSRRKIAGLLIGVALISGISGAVAMTAREPPYTLTYSGQMMQLHHSGSIFLWLDHGDPAAYGATYVVHGASISTYSNSTFHTTVSEQRWRIFPRTFIPNFRPQVLWNQANLSMSNPAPVRRSPLLIVIPLVWGVVLPLVVGPLLWINWAKVLMLRDRRTRGGTRCAKCLYARAGLSTDARCPECGTLPQNPPTLPRSPE